MKSNILDIGDVAARSGLPTSTLRYYEEKGLIASIGRNGIRRIYDAHVLDRLTLIILGRNAGFSLDEIGNMLLSGGTSINRDQLLAKADELDQQIKQLTAIRDGLRHTVECSAPSHLECPTFQQLMRVALKHQQRKNRR